jgi:hypothetical protein
MESNDRLKTSISELFNERKINDQQCNHKTDTSSGISPFYDREALDRLIEQY